MEYVNNINIYTHTCIRIMPFYNVIYTCLLELRLTLATYCESLPCFYNNIVFLYDFV